MKNNKSPLKLLIVWAELLNPVLDLFNFWWKGKEVKQSKVPDIKEVLSPIYFFPGQHYATLLHDKLTNVGRKPETDKLTNREY